MATLPITPGFAIEEADLSIRFVHASGPGGQNVNKVATAVELRFDTRGQTEFPEGMRSRLARLAGQRMTQDGVIILFAQSFRSQLRNRAEAMERLAELLAAAMVTPRKRRPTRPTRGSQERRLTSKAKRSGVKRLRGRPED